jgi:hypothetical protein
MQSPLPSRFLADDASPSPCCMSLKHVIEEVVESSADRGIIVPAVDSEQTTPDERVNFRLAQLNPKAAKPLSAPLAVTAHPLRTGRAQQWSRRHRVGLSHGLDAHGLGTTRPYHARARGRTGLSLKSNRRERAAGGWGGRRPIPCRIARAFKLGFDRTAELGALAPIARDGPCQCSSLSMTPLGARLGLPSPERLLEDPPQLLPLLGGQLPGIP